VGDDTSTSDILLTTCSGLVLSCSKDPYCIFGRGLPVGLKYNNTIKLHLYRV